MDERIHSCQSHAASPLLPIATESCLFPILCSSLSLPLLCISNAIAHVKALVFNILVWNIEMSLLQGPSLINIFPPLSPECKTLSPRAHDTRGYLSQPLPICPASCPHYLSSVSVRALECKQQRTSLSNEQEWLYWKEAGDRLVLEEQRDKNRASQMRVFFPKQEELAQCPLLGQSPTAFILAKLTPREALMCMCVHVCDSPCFNTVLEHRGRLPLC